MSSSSQRAAIDLERAEAALQHRARRHQSPLTFSTSRGVLRWYSRVRNKGATGPLPSTSLRHTGFDHKGNTKTEVVRVSVDGSKGVDPSDVQCAIIDIEWAIMALAKEQPGRVRALMLTVIRGDPETAQHRKTQGGVEGRILLTQEEAAVVLNANQATVSRWVGWCEMRLRPVFVDAGLIVE